MSTTSLLGTWVLELLVKVNIESRFSWITIDAGEGGQVVFSSVSLAGNCREDAQYCLL